MTTSPIRLDPYPHYAKMRATSPVFFNEERNVWEIYRYHDIQAVLGDPATFSSDYYTAAGRPELQTMITMDPPRHTQFRKLISKAFTTKMIAGMEPRIHAIVRQLLDAIADKGKMDLMKSFAFPLPVTVISEMLGTPAEDRDKFKAWADPAVEIAELAMQGLPPQPYMMQAVRELTQYLEELAAERRRHPKEDLLSALATANVDGESLTIQEIGSTSRLLLIGGYETTTTLIGNSLYLLMQDQDAQARLRVSPTLYEPAIDEVLRHSTPFHFFARIAKQDVELGGQLIKAGQQVVVFYGSGNRDPEAFPDPDKFDITRTPNRHLSFGYGIHYCLGAGLARLEAKIAIDAVLHRLPDLRLDPDKPAERLQSAVMYGFRHLPVRFTPVAM